MGAGRFVRWVLVLPLAVADPSAGCGGTTWLEASHTTTDGGTSSAGEWDGVAAGATWVRGAPLSHASTIATDGTNVYWVLGDGNIHAGTVDGGPSMILATDSCHASDRIAVDDAYVYWSAGYVGASCPGHVSRVPKAGGAASVLAWGFVFPDGGIVLDDRSVYFVGGNVDQDASTPGEAEVWAVPKAGGTPRSITDGSATGAPAVDGSYVYWMSSNGIAASGSVNPSTIMRTPRGGGPSIPLATTNRNITALFYFDDRIYWVESGYRGVEYICVDCDMPAEVDSMGASDTSPARAVTMPAGTLIIDGVVDSSALWLSQQGTRSGQGIDYPPNDDHTGAVWKVSPGTAPATVLSGLPYYTFLAIDDARIYGRGDTGPISTTK